MSVWIEKARQGYVANIGQLSRDEIRDLDRAVRRGLLMKYRGYWNTGAASFGMGPLKTIWRAA